ncbi:MAG: hypothetical protein R2710_19205 [Acidimicrobiales bacterium]
MVWLCLIWVVALPTYGFAKTTVTGDQWSGIFTNKNSLGQMSVYAATLPSSSPPSPDGIGCGPCLSIGAAVALLVGSESKTGLATAVLLAALPDRLPAVPGTPHPLRGGGDLDAGRIGDSGPLAIAALPFIADLLDKDVTLTGRTEIWAQLLRTIWNRPIVGYGYGRSGTVGEVPPARSGWRATGPRCMLTTLPSSTCWTRASSVCS